MIGNVVRCLGRAAVSPVRQRAPTFVRFRYLLADIQAARRRMSDEFAAALKAQGFDGSLDGMAEIDQ